MCDFVKPGSKTQEFEMKIVQIIYVVIRAFFKYLVCNIKEPVFERNDYSKFFRYSIKFFTDRFALYKNEFATVHKILKAKEIKLEKMNEEEINKFNIGFQASQEEMIDGDFTKFMEWKNTINVWKQLWSNN